MSKRSNMVKPPAVVVCDIKYNSPDKGVFPLPTSLLARTRAKAKFKVTERKDVCEEAIRKKRDCKQSSPYENHCDCYKKLTLGSWPVPFTFT